MKFLKVSTSSSFKLLSSKVRYFDLVLNSNDNIRPILILFHSLNKSLDETHGTKLALWTNFINLRNLVGVIFFYFNDQLTFIFPRSLHTVGY